MNDQDFFNLGVKLAAASYGKTDQEIVAVSSFVNTISNTKELGYGNMQKMICKIAATAFDEAGRKDDVCYHLFDKLASTDTWFPELDIFSDAAAVSFGKLAMELNDKAAADACATLTKSAQTLLPMALTSLGKSAPDIMKTLAGVGTVGGGIAGGLYWLLNRHANEDEDKAEAIKAKVDYYNKISDEIKSQLALNPEVAPKQKVEKVMSQNIL